MQELLHAERRGFTLLEVLITVVVLSTGLVLVLQGLHNVLHVWRGGVQRTQSIMNAQEQFALIRHAALQGVAPVLQGVPELAIQAGVEGHAGLYRAVYQAEDSVFGMHGEYEMLFFVAQREGGP